VIYKAPALTFVEEDEAGLARFESGSLAGDIAIDDIGMESLIDTQEVQNDAIDGTHSNGQERLVAELDDLLGDVTVQTEEFSFDAVHTAGKKTHSPTYLAPESNDLLNLDMLMNELGNQDQGTTNAPVQSTSGQSQLVDQTSLSMDQEEFKKLWNELSIFSVTFEYALGSPEVLQMVVSEGFSTFENHVKQANLKCIGKPTRGSSTPYRFFFYGKSISGIVVLVNVVINDGQNASIDMRSEDMELTNATKDTLTTLLLTFN